MIRVNIWVSALKGMHRAETEKATHARAYLHRSLWCCDQLTDFTEATFDVNANEAGMFCHSVRAFLALHSSYRRYQLTQKRHSFNCVIL